MQRMKGKQCEDGNCERCRLSSHTCDCDCHDGQSARRTTPGGLLDPGLVDSSSKPPRAPKVEKVNRAPERPSDAKPPAERKRQPRVAKVQLVRKDPPPSHLKKRSMTDPFAEVVASILQGEAGVWYCIASYDIWHGASASRGQLAKRWPKVEFVSRRVRGTPGSEIYARKRS